MPLLIECCARLWWGVCIEGHIHPCQGSLRACQVDDWLGGLGAGIDCSELRGGLEVLGGNQTQVSQNPFSGDTQDAFDSPATRCDTWGECGQPGSSVETWSPGFLLGAGHIVSVYLAFTKLPDSQQEEGNTHHIVCISSLGTGSHLYPFWELMGALPKSELPDASRGPDL